VGIDPLDVLHPLAGQCGQAQPDRYDDLTHDGHVRRREQVLDLLDRPEDDVLDGHDAACHGARGDRLHDIPEAGQPLDGGRLAEVGECRVLGEGAGLTRKGGGWVRGLDGCGCGHARQRTRLESHGEARGAIGRPIAAARRSRHMPGSTTPCW
jgi:hypothetical protein